MCVYHECECIMSVSVNVCMWECECVYCGSVCVCIVCECVSGGANTDHGVCNNVSEVLTTTAEEGINMLPGGIPHIPHCQPINTTQVTTYNKHHSPKCPQDVLVVQGDVLLM